MLIHTYSLIVLLLLSDPIVISPKVRDLQLEPTGPIAVSANQKFAVVVAEDGLIVINLAEASITKFQLTKRNPTVNCLALSPDGGRVYCGTLGGGVYVVDSKSGEKLHESRLPDAIPIAIIPGDTNDHFATLTLGAGFQSWQVGDRKPREDIRLEGGSDRLVYLPTLRAFLGSGTKKSFVYSLGENKVRFDLPSPAMEVKSLIAVPTKATVVAGGADGKIYLISTTTRRIESSIAVSKWPLCCLASSSMGDIIIAADENGQVNCLDLGTGRSRYALDLRHDPPLAILLDSASKYIVTFGRKIRIWDFKTGREVE
jgi:WD40 repeat protein